MFSNLPILNTFSTFQQKMCARLGHDDESGSYENERGLVRWVRCRTCGEGTVVEEPRRQAA